MLPLLAYSGEVRFTLIVIIISTLRIFSATLQIFILFFSSTLKILHGILSVKGTLSAFAVRPINTESDTQTALFLTSDNQNC